MDLDLQELEDRLAEPPLPIVYEPPLGPCYYCGEPSTEVVNVAMNAHWSVPSRMEGVCRRHGLYPEGPPVMLDRATVALLIAEVKRLRGAKEPGPHPDLPPDEEMYVRIGKSKKGKV